MRRIIAGTLALTVLSSTFLLAADAAKVKKAKMKAAPCCAAAQLQQMQDQLNTQQQSINQLQQQLQQSNQQLMAAQGMVKKADQDAASAQQASSAAQQAANSLNSSVADLKSSTAAMNQSLMSVQKDVKDLQNPLALHYKGVTVTPNGRFDAAAFWRQRSEGTTSTSSYSGTPLYGTAAAGLSEFRMTAQNTQVGMTFQGDVGKVKLTGYWQIDFNGSYSSGTAATASGAALPGIVNSNNFYPRLRHAWARAQFDNGWTFMAGQSWFLGMMNRNLIDQLTEWYPVGDDNQTFPGFSQPNRPTQFRVTKNFANNKAAFAIDMEGADLKYVNDGTTPVNVVGQSLASLVTNGYNTSGWTYSADPLPDIWVKLAANPGWGHYEIKGVARFFRDRVLTNGTPIAIAPTTLASKGTNHYSEAGGIGFGTILPLTKKVDFAFNGIAGAGIGTYCGAVANDATLNNNYELVPIKEACFTTGLEMRPAPKFDINFYVAQEYYQRAQYNTNGTYGTPGTTTAGGFGSTLAAPGTDNKTIQIAMASFVYRWYRGSYGTFQTMFEPAYVERTTWAGFKTPTGTVSTTCTTNTYAIDNCTAKGGNFIGILAMQWLLP